MRPDIKQAIRNIVNIIALDLICLPFGIWIYIVHGFHIFHIVLVFGYVQALFKLYETAHILLKYVRIVNPDVEQSEDSEPLDLEHINDSIRYSNPDESFSDEPMKPSMKKAIDEVFFNKKTLTK